MGVRRGFGNAGQIGYSAWRPPAEGQAACEAQNKYTPAAATLRSSMASGAKLFADFSEPCPALTKLDCAGRLVPWGECEAGGEMSWRYTVEVEATMGGAKCPQNARNKHWRMVDSVTRRTKKYESSRVPN